VSRFNIFVIRAILGIAFAVFMIRFFFGRIEPIYVAGLAIFIVGMAYVSEYFRNRR
jgi:hypothetical protein